MTEPEPISRLLERHPLPSNEGDKEQRGVVVLVAGSAECPGGAILSAIAALRAGAGKVQIVTASPIATAVGVAVPEALVLPWDGGEPDDAVRHRLECADAVCIGPGIMDGAADLARTAGDIAASDVPVLLDALAMPAAHAYAEKTRRFLIAPNVDEALDLLTEPVVDQGVSVLAAALTSRLRVPVAVRGETTVLAHGESGWWTKGATGLGTAGSGDVLAGITAGLLARGIDDVAALGWGIAIHVAAARDLAGERANPGFLARELLEAIPDAVAGLST